MKKILVVDGNSIINRAYYGMRPLTTKSGKTTHAVYGMINIISRQMSALKPDYAAVAFDVKHPTFRHEMYPEYKAGRHATPEDLLSQFPDAKECLHLMGMHVIELPGYEADDIQGTVAKMAHGYGDTEAYVLSGDRDLLQLIDDKVTVLLATNSDTKVMGRTEFTEEYGIPPEAFVDMKALMGDSSDNIPGVAGIGKKTAANLIIAYGSLDGIYENIEDKGISKGVREKLKTDKDNAYLSRKLAEINTHAPLDITLEDLKYVGLDKAGLYGKFLELELNSLINKFGLSAEDTAVQIQNEASQNRIDDSEQMPEYAEFDPKKFKKTEHVSVSLQILDGIVYIHYGDGIKQYGGVSLQLCEALYGRKIICYDGKHLWHVMDGVGADMTRLQFSDLMLYAYVLNPGNGTGSVESTVAMFSGGDVKNGYPCVDFFEIAEKKMHSEIEAIGSLDVLEKLELPLMPILAEIEQTGFMINTAAMNEYAEALSLLANDLKESIYVRAGREFNINSPKQLGVVLFEELGLRPPKKTKTGYSTDAETLEQLRSESPIIDDILEYRQVTKLLGTYAEALPAVADSFGRIHTDFKQALTATGRLSSADPNLQNIPIKTKMGREMRRCFVSKPGYSLVDADYSQIELRLLAHISDDYTMKEAFREGEDIHRKTAAAVFGIPEESVNDEMRKRAKAVNFGIVYGISGFSLSKDLGISVDEASRYIKKYLMNYPFIDSYLENVVAKAKEDGFTTTVFGRRRYIPELNAQNGNVRAFGKRVAMNAPIQGTAADIMKLAMIKVYNKLKAESLDAKIVMQVHDELVVEAKDDTVERVKSILKEEMEGAVKLSIPLTVDVTSGKNWLEQS